MKAGRPTRAILLAVIAALIFTFSRINEHSLFYAGQVLTGMQTKPKLKKLPKTDRIDLAWQQETERTLDPELGRVPYERLPLAHAAAEKKRQEILARPKGTGNPAIDGISGIQWTERGPNNVGGRTRALMFDPNAISGKKVWAAGVTGGLWYNDDITSADSPWQKVNDLWDNIAVSCITHDPNNTNVFYVGTGEGFGTGASRGAGIWKTNDGGLTWSQLASSTGFYWVNDIVVRNEDGSSVLYAGVAAQYYKGLWQGLSATGLFRSVDGGATFSQVLPSAGSGPYIASDIEIGADNRIYVGANNNPWGEGGGYLLYSDLGTAGSWTVITALATGGAPRRVELACAPSDANIVYALVEDNMTVGSVAYSSDRGATWTVMSEPNDADTGIPAADFSRGQAWYDLILAVDPNNANTVYAGAIDLFRGNYSGGDISWTQISKWSNNTGLDGLSVPIVHADQHAIVFKSGSSTEALFGTDGGVYYSNNLTGTPPEILERNLNYNTIQYYACAVHPDAGTSHFLAGSQDNGTHRIDQIGLGLGTAVVGGDGAFCHIDQDEPQYQFAAYVYNNLFRSTDGGNSFSQVIASNTGSFINPTDYDDIQNKMYCGYTADNYIVWTDPQTGTALSGVNVASFGGGGVTAVTVSPNTGGRVYFGLNNGLVVRVDDAATSPSATVLNSGIALVAGGSVSSIAIEEGNDSHLMVSYFNYGVTSIWESTNGGSTFSSVEGDLPDMPVRWALFDPTNSDRAVLATEVGVWSTDNLNGASTVWDPSVSGLANVRVDMLQYRTSDNLVAAATHGRGVFTTDAFSAVLAQFGADRTTWLVNRPVQFTDASLQATAWAWDFGDGTTSNEQNPSHVYSGTGTYTVTLSVNGGAATISKTGYITVLADPSIPYSTDFNSNNGAFYAHSISEGQNYWQWGTATATKPNYNPANGLATLEGSASWITNLSGSHGTNTIYALDSPPFNLEGGTGNYTLSFKYRMLPGGTSGSSSNAAGMNVKYSIDGGTTWTILGSTAETGWYTDSHIAGLANEPGIWRSSSTWTTIFSPAIDITGLVGNSDVRFRFSFGATSAQWDGAQLDNFAISGNAIGAIATPAGLTASGFTASSVSLSWNATSSEYRVLRTTGAPAVTPSSGTIVYEGTGTQVTATGLTEGESYYFTVYGKASGSEAYSAEKSSLLATIATGTTVSNTVSANQTGAIAFGASGVSIDITTNDDADGGTVQVERFNTAPAGNNSISGSATAPDGSTVTPNVISSERYWTITSDLTGTNAYSVTFDVSNMSGFANPDRLVILKRNEAGWIAQNTTRNGNFLSAAVTSFSDFGIGANSTDNSLPVSLSLFTLTPAYHEIQLNWVTESELENQEFLLAKSRNGGRFEVVARVPGQGSTSARSEYAFTDTEVAPDNHFRYALSSRDYNGKLNPLDSLDINYSGELLRSLLPRSFALHANYPNPFNPGTTITFDLPATRAFHTVDISIYNLLGQKVRLLASGEMEPGYKTMYWDGSDNSRNHLPSGTYFLVLRTADYSASRKMLLLR